MNITFLVAAAGIIIVICAIRLVVEILQILQLRTSYLSDFANLIEVPLFICAIIFSTVFDGECQCPHLWQWQIGIVAVFFAWIDLILLMRKLQIFGKLMRLLK